MTHDPSRVRIGEWPGPSLRAPPPSEAAVQISRRAPAGSLSGLGISPARFGAPPRTKATVFPSAEIARPATSWPSSRAKEVTGRPVHSGPSASQTLRAPRSLRTQATTGAEGAAVSAVGKGQPTRASRSVWRLWADAFGEAATASTSRSTAWWMPAAGTLRRRCGVGRTGIGEEVCIRRSLRLFQLPRYGSGCRIS